SRPPGGRDGFLVVAERGRADTEVGQELPQQAELDIREECRVLQREEPLQQVQGAARRAVVALLHGPADQVAEGLQRLRPRRRQRLRWLPGEEIRVVEQEPGLTVPLI